MSRFMSSRYASMLPYVPGEQPRDRRYIKLNTNESPFPPSPAVLAALKDENALSLNLYSAPTADALVRAIPTRYTPAPGKGETEITPDMVFACNGSDEVLPFAFAAFGEEPDYEHNELPETTRMPELFGLILTEAASAVKAAGLQYEYSGEGGAVTSQFPVAGSELYEGAVVHFELG